MRRWPSALAACPGPEGGAEGLHCWGSQACPGRVLA